MPSTIRGSDNLDSGKVTGKTKTWQDVTASRALATSYTNSNDYEIWVNVVTGATTAQTCTATVAGQTLQGSSFSSSGNNTAIMFPVPPGASYQVNNIGTSPSLVSWKEYK